VKYTAKKEKYIAGGNIKKIYYRDNAKLVYFAGVKILL
jgi:hypothetical protein